MTKLLVCGSRAITNASWIFSEIEKYLAESNLHYSSIHIIKNKSYYQKKENEFLNEMKRNIYNQKHN